MYVYTGVIAAKFFLVHLSRLEVVIKFVLDAAELDLQLTEYNFNSVILTIKMKVF